MVFAQFFHNSTGWNGKDFSGPVRLIEACGSNAVFIIDARIRRVRQIDTAFAVCKARGYLGFTLRAGPSFSDSREIRALERV